MRRGWIVMAVVGAAFAAGAAVAQTMEPDSAVPAGNDAAVAPAKSKPKAARPKIKAMPSVSVVVVNHRSVGLIELTASLAGGAEPVKIAGPLAAGKKTVAHLAHDKACLFDLRGEFADEAETETESYDLCKNKTIDLVD